MGLSDLQKVLKLLYNKQLKTVSTVFFLLLSLIISFQAKLEISQTMMMERVWKKLASELTREVKNFKIHFLQFFFSALSLPLTNFLHIKEIWLESDMLQRKREAAITIAIACHSNKLQSLFPLH